MYQPIVVAPEIVLETFWGFDPVVKECFRVVISGEEWRICNTTERWCDNKTGNYGGGIGNTEDDPRRVTRIGCLGEMAFAKVFGRKFDDEFKDRGDNFDFFIRGEKIDVKAKIDRVEVGLVYARNDWGRDIRIKMDRYVFGYRQSEDREKETATILLCGWQPKAYVKNRPFVKGYGEKAKHYNKECPFANLLPMQSLYDWARNI
jgi:hypothetical protein